MNFTIFTNFTNFYNFANFTLLSGGERYNIHRMKVASDECSVRKSTNMLTSINMWLLLTRKHLCWSLFLILSIAKFFRALILKNICERLLLKMCLLNLFIKRINFTLKNPIFSTSMSETSENVCYNFMIGFMKFVFIHIQYFFGMVRNKL